AGRSLRTGLVTRGSSARRDAVSIPSRKVVAGHDAPGGRHAERPQRGARLPGARARARPRGAGGEPQLRRAGAPGSPRRTRKRACQGADAHWAGTAARPLPDGPAGAVQPEVLALLAAALPRVRVTIGTAARRVPRSSGGGLPDSPRRRPVSTPRRARARPELSGNRRRHRRMTRLLARVGAVLCAVALLAVGLAGAYSYGRNYDLHRGFSKLVQLPRAGTGRLEAVRFYSPALHRNAGYLVYLPPHYSPARHYPVYYLLHGMPGQPRVFVDIANMDVRLDNQLSLGHARPMILVYPDGRIGGSVFSYSEWANTPAGAFESYVIEVMHNVDQRFATIAHRQ